VTTSASRVAGWFQAPAVRGVLFDPHRQNNFDLLRFVAATLVLIDHSFVLTGRGAIPGPLGYETLGGFAVAVFFVISGFLIAASWERRPALGEFARKRALRILPAYFMVVSVCALILGPALTQLPVGEYLRHPQTWDYFGNLSFFQLRRPLPGVFSENPIPNVINGSLWTLPVEIAMYVALAAFGRAGVLTRRGTVVLVTAIAIVWFGWSFSSPAASLLGPVTQAAARAVHLALWFFAGSALWLWRDRVVYRVDLGVGLLVLAWLTRGTVAGEFLFHVMIPYGLLWIACLRVRWMNRFGRSGDFSYGMYLWAFPVQQTLVQFDAGSWPQLAYVAVSFFVTLAGAVVSWHAVEHPALHRKTGRGRDQAPIEVVRRT
jgi:peptidoglycan/LPS O-acetylase OafA/YrhL